MVEKNLVLRGLEDLDRKKEVLVHHLVVDLLPWPWPYRGAYSFTFDCEGTYGGGSSFKGETEIVPRLAQFFARNSLKATFNFLGKVAEEYGEAVRAVCQARQDIAGHGYSHRNLDGLSESEQESEIQRTVDAIGVASGKRIVGWRCPWGTYDRHTYEVLEQLDFKWASNWSRSMWGSLPFYPMLDGKTFKLVEIPFDDVHFDAQMYNKYQAAPDQVLPLWQNYMAEARRSNGLFVLLSHPVNLAEDIERVEVIEELVSSGILMGDVWICSCGELADRWEALRHVAIFVESMSESRNDFTARLTVENKSNRIFDDLTLLLICPKAIDDVTCEPETPVAVDSMLRDKRVYLKVPVMEVSSGVSLEIKGRFVE